MGLIERLNIFDDAVIEQFRRDVNTNLRILSDLELEDKLVQRRFLSLAFTPFYDQGIDVLEDDEAKQVARELIREEYPQNAPSHREDLVTDLLKIGLTKNRILSARHTKRTKETIDGLYELVAFSGKYDDIKIVSALRTAGEVLVAVEYELIVPELMRRYEFKPECSVFYVLHAEHDQKLKPLGQNRRTHSDKLGSILARLVDTEEKLVIAKQSMDNAYKVKTGFWIV